MKKTLLVISAPLIICSLLSCGNDDSKTKLVSENKLDIKNDSVRIDYTDTGKADTVLLFAHGWCINKTYWTDQVNFFKDRYRVVTMDLPGFGESGKNRRNWTTENYGKDIEAVITQLHLKNVILIGHSMSGDIILEAATLVPDSIIALVGVDNFKTVGQLPTKESKAAIDNAIIQLKQNFKKVAFNYVNQYLFSPSTDSLVRKRVLSDVANADSSIAIASMIPGDFDEAAKLRVANKKLYLINSDVTPTDTTGFISNKISYKINYVHGSGHYPMIEQPAAFNTALEEILADIKKRPVQ